MLFKYLKISLSLGLIVIIISCSKDEPVTTTGNGTIDMSDTVSIIDTVAIADLSLSVSTDNGSPFIDEVIVVSFILENAGPATAKNIEIAIDIPEGLEILNISSADNFNVEQNHWTVTELTQSANIIIKFNLMVLTAEAHIITGDLIGFQGVDPDSEFDNQDENEDDYSQVIIEAKEPFAAQIQTIAILKAADALSLGTNGNLFASSYNNSTVFKIDQTNQVSTFVSSQNGAAGMAFDELGNMYLARYGLSDIAIINKEGNVVEVYADSVARAIAVDFDSKNNLYINNNYSNSITKISNDGNKNTIYTRLFNNSSLTVDDQDNVFVSDYDSGVITKIDSSNETETVFTTLPVSGVGYIDFANGYIFASAHNDHVIFIIDSQGQATIIAGLIGEPGSTDGHGGIAKFSTPLGLIATANGDSLYVAQNGGEGAIRLITEF